MLPTVGNSIAAWVGGCYRLRRRGPVLFLISHSHLHPDLRTQKSGVWVGGRCCDQPGLPCPVISSKLPASSLFWLKGTKFLSSKISRNKRQGSVSSYSGPRSGMPGNRGTSPPVCFPERRGCIASTLQTEFSVRRVLCGEVARL